MNSVLLSKHKQPLGLRSKVEHCREGGESSRRKVWAFVPCVPSEKTTTYERWGVGVSLLRGGLISKPELLIFDKHDVVLSTPAEVVRLGTS